MPPDANEMTLRDYASTLLRRRWIVIIAALLTTLTAIASSVVQTPIYSSDAEVLIQPRGQDGLFDDQIVNVNDRAIQTEIQVIEGQAVRDRVQQNLELDSPPPEAKGSAVGDTDVISVRVRDANAANSATLATAYANAYIEIRREQSVSELLAASAEVQTEIEELQAEIDALDDSDPRRGPLVAQLVTFETTLDQLRVDARLRTGGATIIKEAEVPAAPIEPTPLRTAVVALFVGLLIGVAAAFLIEYLDDKVRDADDLEALTRRPILAEVPVDPPIDHRPLAVTDPTHTSVEAYRGLRTNIQFLSIDQDLDVIQVTSSMAGEGKTTTATNLAVVLARSGNRVALIDADLRRPRVHEVFGVDPEPGLTDILLGASPKDVVQPFDLGDDQSIAVYTAGAIPSNPSEILSGRRMQQLLAQIGEHYDFVVVDSAPILPVSDSVAVGRFVDGVIVVAHEGRVAQGDVVETLERLDRVSAPVVGLVLNQARTGKNEVYAYGGYRSAVEPEAGSRRVGLVSKDRDADGADTTDTPDTADITDETPQPSR